MKKFGVRLLTAIFASSMIVTPVMAAPSSEELEEEKAALEEKKTAKESEVESLQSQLTVIMSELNTLEDELVKKGEEIMQAEADLEAAQEKEEEQYEAMKKRIKYMYEEGEASVLETLVTAENFSELVNKAEYVQSIHTYDREQLDEYIATKQQIADLKVTLEEDQEELESKQTEYEAKGEELNTTIESRQEEVADLDVQIQAAAEEAARVAAEEEAARQAAAQQAAARQAANSSSSNSGSSSNKTSSSNTSSSAGYSSGSAVVSRAYSQLGKPYKWGATGPNSYDCSGFVGYCLTGGYTRIGTAASFMSWTRVSNPQPGDVVTSGTHCGIYIGGGQMIHAPQTGDVVKISAVPSSMIYVRP